MGSSNQLGNIDTEVIGGNRKDNLLSVFVDRLQEFKEAVNGGCSGYKHLRTWRARRDRSRKYQSFRRPPSYDKHVLVSIPYRCSLAFDRMNTPAYRTGP